MKTYQFLNEKMFLVSTRKRISDICIDRNHYALFFKRTTSLYFLGCATTGLSTEVGVHLNVYLRFLKQFLFGLVETALLGYMLQNDIIEKSHFTLSLQHSRSHLLFWKLYSIKTFHNFLIQ